MPPAIRPGEVLAGKFRVERVLGQGGMGVVVEAHHLQLDERVALKFLLPEALGSREVVERFAREARAAAKIRSEHVARVSDVGALPDGAPYMVMEYLEGGDLEAVLAHRGPLPHEEALDLVLQALEALAEAHALGIVHRDLKPANLFVTHRRDGSPCVKVLDFGISKMASGDGSGATQTSTMLGTPLYMAPEQWAGAKNADARSDLWSVGAILYHLLAGRPPFDGDSIPVLWHAVASQTPARLRASRPELPEALDDVVARCLAKEPAARFQSVADLAGALAPLAPARAQTSVERIVGVFDRSGLVVGKTARANVTPMPRAGEAGTGYGFGETVKPSPRAKLGLLAAGVGVLVLGGLGVRLATSSQPAAPAAVGLVASSAAAPAVPDAEAPLAVAAVQPPAAPSATASAAPIASDEPPRADVSARAMPARPSPPARKPAATAAPATTTPAATPKTTAPSRPPPKRGNADDFN